jgi:hypothetical protein
MDISARKQAEDERALQRKELEHLGRVNTLTELSGTLAHEINQPLAIIMSNTEAAQRLLDQPDPDHDELRAILADILAADERADAVVRRLRAMLRRGPVERESLVLDATVLAALDFLSGELRRRGVEVKTDLQAGEARIWGDRVSFDQVLINLINNACDAMAAQSASPKILTLRTAREAEASYRAKEAATAAEHQRITDAAHQQTLAARADADRVRAALDRLRRAAAAAAHRGDTGPHPAAPASSSPATAASHLPADLLGRLGDAAGELAAAADASRNAGNACQRAYQALTPTNP